MDISKHCQVSPRNKTIVETYHSSADDQQRKKEEVGSICFEDIIFPGLVLGPVALMQGILGSVVHFVVKRSRWPCLGSIQPCLCSTISLGYWVIRRGGSWGSQQIQWKVTSEGWALCPPPHSGCYVTVSPSKDKEARGQGRKCSP